ncbi:hypothetical protein SOVF_144240 [Spinacia oleracea]|uniref:Agamous-like MADS-box protein AGL80 n=1 Tax=Spinacia oleracea TaxID=3562 RepID=A0A9R0JTU3_SPIOL|nr:agamous-like MADS-box protein AGL80 [Spinacia oleracea]KNA10446.1 hypothetical protein SOVF_144240 [Spinacia oleracea]
MTRKKVKLAFIANDSARKATYKKRKRGLLKKMDELTTLCDVKACAILYSPYEARPVVWPGPSGARDVIASFKRLPEMEKVKKMVSQEEFLRQRVAKAHDQLKKQQKDNREKDMTQVMYQCLTGKSIQNMSLLDLSDLGWVINQHLSEINNRVDALKKENPSPNNNKNKIHNSNIKNNIRNNVNIQSESGQPPHHQNVVGPEKEGEGLQEEKEDFERPWSSFMDMIGPPMFFDHQPHPPLPPHPHHNMGMGGRGLGYGLSGVTNGSASSSTSNNNNMMMMMGQFGEYHGHGINPNMWSSGFFP